MSGWGWMIIVIAGVLLGIYALVDAVWRIRDPARRRSWEWSPRTGILMGIFWICSALGHLADNLGSNILGDVLPAIGVLSGVTGLTLGIRESRRTQS